MQKSHIWMLCGLIYSTPGSPKKEQLTQQAIKTLQSMSFTPPEIEGAIYAEHCKHGISVDAVKDVISEMNKALEENLDLEARKELYNQAQEWTIKCAAIRIFYEELGKKMIKENLTETGSKYLLTTVSRRIAYRALVTAFLIQSYRHYETLRSPTKKDQEGLRKEIEDTFLEIKAFYSFYSFNCTDFAKEFGISPTQFQEAQIKLIETAHSLEVDLPDDDTSIQEISENEDPKETRLTIIEISENENPKETRLTISE